MRASTLTDGSNRGNGETSSSAIARVSTSGYVRDQRDALTMSVGHGHISRLPAGQRPSVGIPSGGVDQIGVGLKCRFRFLAVRVSVGILHDAVAGTYSETAHAGGEIACARSADWNAGTMQFIEPIVPWAGRIQQDGG